MIFHSVQVVSQMSSAIGDMSQGFFMLPESGEFSVITSSKNLPFNIQSWRDKMYLAHASLLINVRKFFSVCILSAMCFYIHTNL